MWGRKRGTPLRLTWKDTISAVSERGRDRGEFTAQSETERIHAGWKTSVMQRGHLVLGFQRRSDFTISEQRRKKRTALPLCWRPDHFIQQEEYQLWQQQNSPRWKDPKIAIIFSATISKPNYVSVPPQSFSVFSCYYFWHIWRAVWGLRLGFRV